MGANDGQTRFKHLTDRNCSCRSRPICSDACAVLLPRGRILTRAHMPSWIRRGPQRRLSGGFDAIPLNPFIFREIVHQSTNLRNGKQRVIRTLPVGRQKGRGRSRLGNKEKDMCSVMVFVRFLRLFASPPIRRPSLHIAIAKTRRVTPLCRLRRL